MRHFCSLWDSRYCAQGVALYESILRHSSEPFTLHVLPMDVDCWVTLKQLDLPHVELVRLELFEVRTDLIAVRASRTWAEYCWSCASVLSWDLLSRGLHEISYVDADCWFAADPEIALREIANRSIGIVPHRFTENADRPRLEKAGRFNVSLVHFKNNPIGRACLSKWAAQVLERCSADSYGDQLYVESFTDFGDECAIIEHIGVGLAPWNVSSYQVTMDYNGAYVNGTQICMYHFHELRTQPDGSFFLSGYKLSPETIAIIYEPYVSKLRLALSRIDRIHAGSAYEESSTVFQSVAPIPSTIAFDHHE